MQNKLTVVVLTHNDEDRIVDCLECLGFASEIVIIDDNSSDRTIELARNYTKEIYVHPLNGNFSNQRNYALNHVHNQWVLFIDSDELVSTKLSEEILAAINRSGIEGYLIHRIDYMWGRKILHGEAGKITLLRLAKKDSGKWHGKVHEEWKVEGRLEELRNPLIHTPHQSVREFIEEVNMYSTVRAQELAEVRLSPTPLSIFIYPTAKFIHNYFLRKGYKDGIPGFLYATIMSLHSFLVRAKLYQIKNNG